ncbi:MAG: hypothetical protein AMS27_02550 [Bacteroides sp. SM23_62_1]|nr:MAG: hypothetical protein AMS27_02550 [Bacteroides sp. SM23_62_1]
MPVLSRFVFIIIICYHCIYIPPNNVKGLIYNVIDTINFTHPIDTLDSLMRYYNSTGYKYLTQGDYELAKDNFIKSLDIKQKILSENDRRIGNDHHNLGVIYEKLWNYELALNHYNEAEKIFQNIDSNYVHIGSIYVNKAIIYRKLQDYQKAIDYYNHALRIFNKQDSIDYEKLSIVYYNLGIIYEFIDDYEKAINHFQQSLLFDHNKTPIRQLNIYNGLALNYSKLNNQEIAKKFYEQSIIMGENRFGKNDYRLASYYINYGLFLIENTNQYEIGFNYYKKALGILLDKYGENDLTTLLCLNNIGEYYLTIGKIDSALYYIQKALIGAFPNSVILSKESNPNKEDLSFNPRALSTLKLKAKALNTNYSKDYNLKSLKLALETYLLVYVLIDEIRLKYENEVSNFIISEKEDDTFITGINISEMLYILTNDTNYKEIAFEINEKRIAFSLLTSIRKMEAKEFGGIPAHLLKEENDLYRQMAAYEELIYEEKRLVHPDKNRLYLWEERLFKLSQEYERLINRFELEYPKYYQLKYDVKVKSIPEITNKINAKEAVIEYSLSDSLIHYFVISHEEYNLYTVKIDSTFFNNLEILTLDMSTPNFSSGVHASYRRYVDAAYALYRVLIEPCAGMIRDKSLIIIPDGILSYLPFEALLTHPVMNDEPDYRNLPYLVRDYDIGYAYSATLHFEVQRSRERPSGSLLAFAPDYSNVFAQNIIDFSYLEAYRDQLVPIPGVKDEVRKISRLIRSDVYLDESATENNFKRHAADYDILHLAMHTIVDNENPMYSKLAFTQNIDSVEDGFLNTYEIYNMKYNARMAVLSSCKTGYGRLQKGEGVMSLARGFMYAGCPSIVMTLWEVSDKSGALLMENFYRELKKGKTKTEALREAKLEFLRKADQLKANPYFWSTYVAIGDDHPLYPPRSGILWIISVTILVVAAVITITWYLRVRRMRNKSGGSMRQDTIYT